MIKNINYIMATSTEYKTKASMLQYTSKVLFNLDIHILQSHLQPIQNDVTIYIHNKEIRKVCFEDNKESTDYILKDKSNLTNFYKLGKDTFDYKFLKQINMKDTKFLFSHYCFPLMYTIPQNLYRPNNRTGIVRSFIPFIIDYTDKEMINI